MRITFLGTADAFNGAGRAHAAYWVDDAAGAFSVDFGPTALMQCKRLGRDPDALDAVFLTHLHGDHTGGLAVLLIDLQYRARRERPICIGGPPGTAERVHLLMTSAYPSILQKGLRFPVLWPTWTVPGTVQVGSRRVTAIPAVHDRAGNACSLRVETDGRRLAFSGDTGWQSGLAELSAGVDLFVCECSSVEPQVPEHLSLVQLEALRARLTPKRLYLTHMDADVRREATRIRAMDAIAADDGDVVELEPGP